MAERWNRVSLETGGVLESPNRFHNAEDASSAFSYQIRRFPDMQLYSSVRVDGPATDQKLPTVDKPFG